MTDIVQTKHVDELIGSGPYTNSYGTEISPVMYEAVEEYLHCLETGTPYDVIHFFVSEETALCVWDNVKQLASKLNDGGEPNYKRLRADLYEFFSPYLDLNKEGEVIEGTHAYSEHQELMKKYRTALTEHLTDAFQLPNAVLNNELNLWRLSTLSGGGKLESTSLESFTGGLAVSAGLTCLIAAASIFWPEGAILYPLLPIPFVLSSLLAVPLVGEGVNAELKYQGTDVKISKSFFGRKKRRLNKVLKNWDVLMEPREASMKNYLLHNNPNVTGVETV